MVAFGRTPIRCIPENADEEAKSDFEALQNESRLEIAAVGSKRKRDVQIVSTVAQRVAVVKRMIGLEEEGVTNVKAAVISEFSDVFSWKESK